MAIASRQLWGGISSSKVDRFVPGIHVVNLRKVSEMAGAARGGETPAVGAWLTTCEDPRPHVWGRHELSVSQTLRGFFGGVYQVPW